MGRNPSSEDTRTEVAPPAGVYAAPLSDMTPVAPEKGWWNPGGTLQGWGLVFLMQVTGVAETASESLVSRDRQGWGSGALRLLCPGGTSESQETARRGVNLLPHMPRRPRVRQGGEEERESHAPNMARERGILSRQGGSSQSCVRKRSMSQVRTAPSPCRADSGWKWTPRTW